MIRVELNTLVARPTEDVFARLTDFSDYSRWMPRLGIFLECGQTSEGPVGEGTTYYDRGRMGTFRGEIAEFRAPTRVAFRESLKWLGVEVMEARPSYELVPTQAGTEVRHRAEGRLFGIFGLMEPVVAWVARGERKRTVEALKAYEWSKWWQIADANRRKILAQASQIRLRFLDPYMADPATREIPLIVCGDINDGPGLDASEKRLFGSGIERLMGTVWRPELCLRNALFDSLTDEEQVELDFEAIATTSFQDSIFNYTWHREWIDHILYTESPDETWLVNAEVHERMPDGTPIWERYERASDHYPVSAAVTT